ncbi:MAG: DUF3098 domain-containing protein [Saprospiraceae bacterium]|nr:DUF3098 domain-containing protein [Saprospiraceae bacterium]
MSQKKKPTKRTVVVTKKQAGKKERLKPTSSRARAGAKQKPGLPLIFDWQNYRLMLIGIGLIALGMLLMSGGSMPSPDVWDDSIIYSFRRTVLAPICIVAGLLVEVYAIFKNY